MVAAGIRPADGKVQRRHPGRFAAGREGYDWLQHSVFGRNPRARLTALAAQLRSLAASLAEIAWCLRNPHVSSVLLARQHYATPTGPDALDIGARGSDDATWSRIEAVA